MSTDLSASIPEEFYATIKEKASAREIMQTRRSVERLQAFRGFTMLWIIWAAT